MLLEVQGHALSMGVLCYGVIKPMRGSELEGEKYREMERCGENARCGHGGGGVQRMKRLISGKRQQENTLGDLKREAMHCCVLHSFFFYVFSVPFFAFQFLRNKYFQE